MKKLLLSIATLVILSAGSTFAQNQSNISTGLRVGTNFSTFQGKDVEGHNYVIGLDIAIPVEVSFNEKLAIQPELHFIQKGSGLNYDELDQKLRGFYNYLELPILLKGKIGDEKLSAYAIAGPSFGYAINRNLVTIEDGNRESESFDFDKDIDNRFEFGAQLGLGAELQAGRGKLVLDARYGFDFNGFTKADFLQDDNPNYNSGIAVTVGYMLPLNL